MGLAGVTLVAAPVHAQGMGMMGMVAMHEAMMNRMGAKGDSTIPGFVHSHP